MSDEWIRQHVRCCSCGKPLKKSKHINFVCLDKLATWNYPTWGNILVKEKYPEPRASAVICDKCLKEKRIIKYAVEWSRETGEVKYHPVSELRDLPPIPEEEVAKAEAELYNFKGSVEVDFDG
jgi:hypothetical protein